MDISKLSHDKAKVSSALVYKDQAIVAKSACKIMIPSSYFDSGLAVFDPEVFSLAVFAIIVEDRYYSFSMVTSMMRLTPTDRYEIMVGDDAYTIFEFDKGATITPNRQLVMRDTLIYNTWQLFINQASRPWFITEEHISELFEEAKKWTGVQLGGNPAILQTVIATTTRNAANLDQQYRHALIEEPAAASEAVPLRSIIFGPSNTLSRTNGPYFSEGLPTALVNQSDRSEPLEEMIRR